MSDCLFCKIANSEIPTDKVYEDDKVLAFNDIDPQAPVHFLVIPKEHIASAAEITADNSGIVAHIFEDAVLPFLLWWCRGCHSWIDIQIHIANTREIALQR